MQGVGVVSNHIKTAAFHGTLGPEGTDDDVPALPYRPRDLPNVCLAPPRVGEEMKNGANQAEIKSCFK